MSAEAEKVKKTVKITEVSYGMTVSLPNYENVKFHLTAKVAADDDWRDVLDVLRRRSTKIRAQVLTDGY